MRDENKILELFDITDAHTIYSIIGRMETLMALCDKDPDLKGINPFLKTYYYVTKEVATLTLENKEAFEDAETLQKLDIIFAGEFFKAVRALIKKGDYITPWKSYFEYSLNQDHSAFVKMLLGINAHINGDLAISLYKADYKSEKDFLLINEVLLEVIPIVMKYLAINHKDLLGAGAYVFKDFTRHEFEKTVVKWRREAWEDFTKITEDNLGEYQRNLYEKAESRAEKIITIFSLESLKHPEEILNEIHKM